MCHKYKAITGRHVKTTDAFFRKMYHSEGFFLNKFSQKSSENVTELVSTLFVVSWFVWELKLQLDGISIILNNQILNTTIMSRITNEYPISGVRV